MAFMMDFRTICKPGRAEKGTAQNSNANPPAGTHPPHLWQEGDREQKGQAVSREMQEASTTFS